MSKQFGEVDRASAMVAVVVAKIKLDIAITGAIFI